MFLFATPFMITFTIPMFGEHSVLNALSCDWVMPL